MVLHATTVEQPRLFTAVCRAVCSQADACNGQWLAGFESTGRSHSRCAAVLLTDVGRKLRQERFASALLVLRVEPLIAPVRCMPIGLSTPSAVAGCPAGQHQPAKRV
jgi:hypothetical protein